MAGYYLSLANYKTRVGSDLLPTTGDGTSRVADDRRISNALEDAAGLVQGALPRDLFDESGAELSLTGLAPWLQQAVPAVVRVWAQYLLTDVVTGSEALLKMRLKAADDALKKICHNADVLRVIPGFGEGDASDIVTPSATGVSYSEIARYAFPFAFTAGAGLYATTILLSLLEPDTLYTMRINDTENQGTRTDELALMTREMFDAVPASQMSVVQVAADTSGAGVSSESGTANYFRVDAGLFGRSNDFEPVVLFSPPRANTGPFVLTLARVIA